jgi:hypothetical protein
MTDCASANARTAFGHVAGKSAAFSVNACLYILLGPCLMETLSYMEAFEHDTHKHHSNYLETKYAMFCISSGLSHAYRVPTRPIMYRKQISNSYSIQRGHESE